MDNHRAGNESLIISVSNILDCDNPTAKTVSALTISQLTQSGRPDACELSVIVATAATTDIIQTEILNIVDYDLDYDTKFVIRNRPGLNIC